MTRALRTLAIAATLALATSAGAQTNPLSRSNVLNSHTFKGSALGGSSKPIAPPGASFGPVTPVPEPSTWAMLVGGVALLGFALRRRAVQR